MRTRKRERGESAKKGLRRVARFPTEVSFPLAFSPFSRFRVLIQFSLLSRFRVLYLILCAHLWFIPLRAVWAAELRIPYERYRLPNGLTVILHEDRSTPQVAVNLWYGVGSASERPGRTGFAHLFEHLMFMGSRDAPEGVFDQLTEAEGGFSNATTAEDRTNFFEQGPSHLLETFLWLEADRMATLGASLSLDQLNRQREVVRNERRETYENQPYGIGDLLLPGALYPRGHPYSWPVIGSHADLTAASLEDVRGFFAKFYCPANASMVIAGEFDPAQARRWVDQYFGWITGPPAPPRPQAAPNPLVPPGASGAAPGSWLLAPGRSVGTPASRLASHRAKSQAPMRAQSRSAATQAARRLTVTDRVALPQVTMAWHSPALYAPGDAACDVLAAILGQGKSSRLYRELVYRRQIAQEVTVSQEPNRLGSVFSIQVLCSPGHTAGELERAIDLQLARLRARSPSEHEMQRARNRIEADSLRELEPLAQRADLLNHYQFYLGDPGAIGRDLARYRRVTPLDVQRLAATLLRPQSRLILRVVPVSQKGGTQHAAQGTPPVSRAMVDPPLRGVCPPRGGVAQRAAGPDLLFSKGPSSLRLCAACCALLAGSEATPVPDFMTRRPTLIAPRPVSVPAAQRFRLRNGLEVVLVERHTLPLVEMRMTIKQGAAADPPDRIGLASLVTEMLEEGAGRRSSPQIADELDFLAAELSSSAEYERSTVQLSALKRALLPAFDLFTDVIRRPRFPVREIARIRKQRLADLAQQRTEPEEVARVVFRRAVYGDRHPYGRPVNGYVATVRAVRRRDLERFHQAFYRPDNALLVVAGDLTPAELRPLVEHAFGDWQGKAGVRRKASGVRSGGLSLTPDALRLTPGPQRHRLVLVPFPAAPQSVLRIGHPGPSRLSPEYPALEALNVILGGAFTSRLNQNLRERHGYTYGASSQFAWERGPGPFVVATSVFRKQTGPALAECLGELTRIRQGTITAAELRKATATVRQEHVRELAELSGLLAVFSEEGEFGLPADESSRFLARLTSLTTDDLHRAARWLHPDQATVVIVGDLGDLRRALATPALARAHLGAPELRDAQGAPLHGAGTAPTTKTTGTK
jgi:zinc protease